MRFFVVDNVFCMLTRGEGSRITKPFHLMTAHSQYSLRPHRIRSATNHRKTIDLLVKKGLLSDDRKVFAETLYVLIQDMKIGFWRNRRSSSWILHIWTKIRHLPVHKRIDVNTLLIKILNYVNLIEWSDSTQSCIDQKEADWLCTKIAYNWLVKRRSFSFVDCDRAS